MKFSDLVKKDQPPESTASKPVGTTNPAITCIEAPGNRYAITHDETKANIDQDEGKTPAAWKDLARAYAAKFDIRILPTLREVLLARAAGHKALTLREAEIGNRTGTNFGSEFLWAGLKVFGAHLCEDNWFNDDDLYTLRIRFNNGIYWRDHNRAKSTPEVIEAGDRNLKRFPERLAALGLPLYPFELEQGFDVDLLKPEWGKHELFLARQKAIREGTYE